MPPVSTAAIVLHAFPYGESSKIVRLATRDYGVVSALAKGAHQPKSRFGARLQPLSEGMARLYLKQNRDLHTLAEFDVRHQRLELAHDLHRFAAAAAVAEIVLRFSPQEPHPEIFELLQRGLDSLLEPPPGQLQGTSLAVTWSVVAALGFAPAVDHCAVDGASLTVEDGEFSISEGGFVCAACARSRQTASLPAEDRALLVAFVAGAIPPTPVPPPRAAAHRRLVARFIRRHVAEGRDLHALDFWETLP